MNVSSEFEDCVPINFTNRLIYEPKDLETAMELLRLSYPNKDNTFGNWGELSTGWVIAFYIHIVIFGIAHFALGTASLIILIRRDLQGNGDLKKLDHKIVYTLTCINILVIIFGYSKFLFLVLDPYFISDYLTCEYCHIPWSLMKSLTVPSITTAYTMEYFTLWLCVQLVQDSVFNKCRFVVLFSFFNYVVAIVVQIISNLFVYPAIIIIIACAIYFICFGIVVCLAYILTAWRVLGIIKDTARRATLTSSSMIPKHESTNNGTADTVSTKHKGKINTFRQKYTTAQKSAIRKISKICYGTALLGLLLSVVQIVLLVLLAQALLTDCISSSNLDKNSWLVFQYFREIVELALGIILLYCTADFNKLWKWMKKLCLRRS